MKTKKTISFLLALLIAGSISAYAGGLVETVTNTFTGGGGDRGPATNGKVTVRGLSRYDGKYVMGLADSAPALLAAGNISSGGVISAAAIKGGKAALKVWQSDGGVLGNFDGNLTDTLILSIYDGEAPTNNIAMGLVEVNFRKGSGSGTGTFIGGGAFGGVIDRGLDNVVTNYIANANVNVVDSGGGSSGASSSNGGGSGGGLLGGLFGGLFGGGKNSGESKSVASDGESSGGSGGGLLGGLFGGLFGGGKNSGESKSVASDGESSGGSGSGLLGGLFGGGSSGGGGGIGWTEIHLRDFEWPNGTWAATYVLPIEEGIQVTFVQTFTIRGEKATSHVMKQTWSGPNADSLWPMLKMAYESGYAYGPGTHRVIDAQRTIETTYDPDDPIFSGGAYERTGDSKDIEDSVHAYINTARNRIRIVVDINSDILSEIVYIKQ